jgi:hypothetical protein
MRFYFDIADDFYSALDHEGTDLGAVEAARLHATDIATSVARDVVTANGSQVVVTVRDETESLFDVTLTVKWTLHRTQVEFLERDRP